MTPKLILLTLLTCISFHIKGQSSIESYIKQAENPEFIKDTIANSMLYAVSLLSPNPQITPLILAHGNIKEIHVKAYDAGMKFGNVEKRINTIRTIDVFLYNDSIRLYYRTPDKKLTEKYYFDDFGVYKILTYRNNRLQQKIVFEYNNNGLNTEINTFDAKKRLCAKSVYLYDNSGKCITKNMYDSHGALTVQMEFKYDIQKRLCELKETTQESEHIISVYQYHKNGLCAKKHEINKVDTATTFYQYDTRNNCINKITPLKNIAYCYDNRDNVIEDLSFSANGDFINRMDINYEYDNRGNWTRLICVSEFTKSGIILERQIIYRK